MRAGWASRRRAGCSAGTLRWRGVPRYAAGTTGQVATWSGAGSLVLRAPRRGAPAHRGRARRRAMRVVARPTASVAKTAARLRGKHPITRGLAARIFPGVSRRAARYEIALGRAGLTVVPAVAGLVLASVLA